VSPSPSQATAESRPGVLIADDEASIRWVLDRVCQEEALSSTSVGTGAEALAVLRNAAPEVAFLDIRLPDMSGLDVLRVAREERLETLIIVITAQNTMANAIEATKAGAYDYLTKPFELDEVRRLIRRARELRRMTHEIQRLRGELGERYDLVVGKTPAMQEIYKIIGRVASTEATVLIQGETGTGKELIARAIHYHSGRSGAFVAVNCSAIPHDLLESELFGYERGAFTGAFERRLGKLEAPAGGTLFLDEIADMPLDLQTKLLRVLQEREFTRVGGSETIRMDARTIAATNQDLEAAVRARRFREDLFFRLRVVPITVPPLRERRPDIPELIDFFTQKINQELGTHILGLTPEAADALMRHPWPGNVRELENTLMRASVLARGRTIVLDDLALSGARPSGPGAEPPPLEAAIHHYVRELLRDGGTVRPRDLHATVLGTVERPLFAAVLEATGGNQLRAAEILGLNRNTLRKKLTDLGITPKRGPKPDAPD
jgi:two-component system nitrogen regulation response regulator GlnG